MVALARRIGWGLLIAVLILVGVRIAGPWVVGVGRAVIANNDDLATRIGNFFTPTEIATPVPVKIIPDRPFNDGPKSVRDKDCCNKSEDKPRSAPAPRTTNPVRESESTKASVRKTDPRLLAKAREWCPKCDIIEPLVESDGKESRIGVHIYDESCPDIPFPDFVKWDAHHGPHGGPPKGTGPITKGCEISARLSKETDLAKIGSK